MNTTTSRKADAMTPHDHEPTPIFDALCLEFLDAEVEADA
jgi:hypothetical protein